MTGVLLAAAVAGALVIAAVRWRRARRRWHRVLRGPGRPGPLTPAMMRDAVDRLVRSRHQGRAVAASATVLGVVGWAASGPVAAVLASGYGATALVLTLRRRRQFEQVRSRADAIDAVAGLAADVRAGAGLPHVADAVRERRAAADGAPALAVVDRLACAVAVAEESGAPLADLLDRLDTHLRAVDRAATSARAQAAGVRASAVLLAVLPVAGVGLGALVGVDSGHLLLHTPLGATCVVAAAALQLVGLAWSIRLSRFEVAV